MAFGADGYLYIAQGDGGGGGDPENNAQNTSELLGKILRIDVNVPDAHPQGFVVPAGNAGLPRPEIWSLGWRNPWKFSFDAPARGGTGAMIVADVGQGAWEEIDYEPAGRAGRNYGWRCSRGRASVHRLDDAAARRSHLRLRPRRLADRSREATSIVALRSRRCAADISLPTTRRAASGRCI